MALASHHCGPGLILRLGVIHVMCGLSLLLVLVLSPRGFSPGTPVSPSLQKPKFPNSNLIWRVSPISTCPQKPPFPSFNLDYSILSSTLT